MAHHLNKHFIRAIMLLILSQIFGYSGAAFSSQHGKVLEASIGKLVALHDTLFSYQNNSNSFGSAEVFVLFEQEYKKNIKTLPVEYRIKYFWASMWHLNFDGDYMEQFQEIIYSDCGELFLIKLQKYIAIENELKRDKAKLYLTSKVYSGLMLIERNRKKK